MGLPELCDIDGACSAWKYRYFGDCVCSPRDEVSFFLGLASIMCWGVAEIPQIIANWRAGNSEGVSLAFILTWTVGDVFNLVGCLMDPVTLPTQFYTAVLYTATTLVLVAQHIWYNWWKEPEVVHPASYQDKESPRLKGWESTALEGLFPSDPTLADGTKIPGVDTPARNSRSFSTPMASSQPSAQQSPNSYTGSWRRLTLASSYGTSPRLRALMIAALVTGGLRLGSPLLWGAGTLPSGTSSGFVMGEGGRKLLQTQSAPLPLEWGGNAARHMGAIFKEDDTKLRDIVGQILGWAMTAIYLTGRLPQIILNITRGSVEGLSWSMFAFAIGGNATYLGSILARSLEWTRLKANLPWLVDSACCLAMDFFILGQCAYYSAKAYRQKRRAGYLELNGQ